MKQSDEEFECSECGRIISNNDKQCPHCNAIIVEDEIEIDKLEEEKLPTTSSIHIQEKSISKNISLALPALTITNNLELKLFERSELKNIIREILKSNEGDFPVELFTEKKSLESIFKQL